MRDDLPAALACFREAQALLEPVCKAHPEHKQSQGRLIHAVMSIGVGNLISIQASSRYSPVASNGK